MQSAVGAFALCRLALFLIIYQFTRDITNHAVCELRSPRLSWSHLLFELRHPSWPRERRAHGCWWDPAGIGRVASGCAIRERLQEDLHALPGRQCAQHEVLSPVWHASGYGTDPGATRGERATRKSPGFHHKSPGRKYLRPCAFRFRGAEWSHHSSSLAASDPNATTWLSTRTAFGPSQSAFGPAALSELCWRDAGRLLLLSTLRQAAPQERGQRRGKVPKAAIADTDTQVRQDPGGRLPTLGFPGVCESRRKRRGGSSAQR